MVAFLPHKIGFCQDMLSGKKWHKHKQMAYVEVRGEREIELRCI